MSKMPCLLGANHAGHGRAVADNSVVVDEIALDKMGLRSWRFREPDEASTTVVLAKRLAQ